MNTRKARHFRRGEERNFTMKFRISIINIKSNVNKRMFLKDGQTYKQKKSYKKNEPNLTMFDHDIICSIHLHKKNCFSLIVSNSQPTTFNVQKSYYSSHTTN